MLVPVLALLVCSVGARVLEVPSFNGSFPEAEKTYTASKDVKFHLFTQENPKVSQIIRLFNRDDLDNSHFDPKNPTRILIHGWLRDISDDLLQGAKTEFTKKGPHNVICVDWGAGALTSIYLTARGRVDATAKTVADFIGFLIENGGARPSNIIVVGHSLGAHIAGTTGKYYQKMYDGQRLPFIVGLDPAGYPFENPDKADTLRKGDAAYVEIMHTSAGNPAYKKPNGNVDFFPNGGTIQKGCELDLTGTCSHLRAQAFYVESINNPTGFRAQKCISYESLKSKGCTFEDEYKYMSDENNYGEGIFYLETRKSSPYALG